ncbi:MAG: sugar phosphate nucleotidyltransferase [Candidatus Woesearchaeota archaeon]
MKERITITIDQELLDALDNQIDGVMVKNRSHAIELNLSKTLKRQHIAQAIILAGGKHVVEQEGKELPTFMIEINGRTILEHNILMLKRQGIKEFIIAVGYKKEMVKDRLGDGSHFGVSLRYIEEEHPLGTSGVIRKAAPLINSTFLVCNGDELKEINIKEMFEFHKKQGTSATIAVTTASSTREYGEVVLNGNRVYSFVEKPKSSTPTNLINAGLYIFDPEVITEAPEGYGRLESDVFPKLADDNNLAGYIFYGKWMDVRNQQSLKHAEMNW